jgi:hypothetical protein
LDRLTLDRPWTVTPEQQHDERQSQDSRATTEGHGRQRPHLCVSVCVRVGTCRCEGLTSY